MAFCVFVSIETYSRITRSSTDPDWVARSKIWSQPVNLGAYTILSEKQHQNILKGLGEKASTNQQTDRQTYEQTDRQTHHCNQYILENLTSSIFKSNDTANPTGLHRLLKCMLMKNRNNVTDTTKAYFFRH